MPPYKCAFRTNAVLTIVKVSLHNQIKPPLYNTAKRINQALCDKTPIRHTTQLFHFVKCFLLHDVNDIWVTYRIRTVLYAERVLFRFTVVIR